MRCFFCTKTLHWWNIRDGKDAHARCVRKCYRAIRKTIKT